MKDLLKFESIFAFAILVVLCVALFVFKDSKEISTTILTCLIGGFSAVSAYFFTKHVPNQDKDGE